MASRSSNTIVHQHHYDLSGLVSLQNVRLSDASPPNCGLLDAAVDRHWPAGRQHQLAVFRNALHSPATTSVALFNATKEPAAVTPLDPTTPPADRPCVDSCPLCGVRFGLESGKAAPKRMPGCGHNFCAECIFSQCLHREYYLLEAINCVRCGAECEARAAMNAPIDYALCERLVRRHNVNALIDSKESGTDDGNKTAPQLNQSAFSRSEANTTTNTATIGAGNNVTVIRVQNAAATNATQPIVGGRRRGAGNRRRQCAVVAPTPQRPPAANWLSADGSAQNGDDTAKESENNGQVYDLSVVDVRLRRMARMKTSPNANTQKDGHSDYGSGGSIGGTGAPCLNAAEAKCVECRMACRRVTCVRRAIAQLSTRFDVDATKWRRQRGGDGDNDDDLISAFEDAKSLIADEALLIIYALSAHRQTRRRNRQTESALIHEETADSDTAYSSAASVSVSQFLSCAAMAALTPANTEKGDGRRDVYKRLRRERTQKLATLARQLSAMVPVVETVVKSGIVAETSERGVDAPHLRLSAAARDASVAIRATLALLRVVQPTSGESAPHPYNVSASTHFLSLEKCATALTTIFGTATAVPKSPSSAPRPSSYLDVEESLRGAARALTWLISANERIVVPTAAILLISAAFANCFRSLRLVVALRGNAFGESPVSSPSRRRRQSAAIVECHRRSWKAAQIGYGELLRCASMHWHSAAAPQRVAIVAELAGVCALFADVCDTATILVCMIEAARARAATPFTNDATTTVVPDGGEGLWRTRRDLGFHLKRIDDHLAECRRVQKLAELRSRTRLAKRSTTEAESPGAISTSCVIDAPIGRGVENATPKMEPAKVPKQRRLAFLRRLFTFSAPFEKKKSKVTAV